MKKLFLKNYLKISLKRFNNNEQHIDLIYLNPFSLTLRSSRFTAACILLSWILDIYILNIKQETYLIISLTEMFLSLMLDLKPKNHISWISGDELSAFPYFLYESFIFLLKYYKSKCLQLIIKCKIM